MRSGDRADGKIRVLGADLYYRSFGARSSPTILGLSGGPGGAHDFLLPLADLVQFGYRVVLFDAVGCGASSRPRSGRFYTQQHAVDEVEGVRRALRLGAVHLFGASYGGALALDVATTRPDTIQSLHVSSGFASEAQAVREYQRLVRRLPHRVRTVLRRFEGREDPRNPEYLRAFDVLRRKHYNRLDPSPYDLWYAVTHLNPTADRERLAGWDITDRLSQLDRPCLITVGRHDIVTPRCARSIHESIAGSKLVIFSRSAHAPYWEERQRFMRIYRSFLDGLEPRHGSSRR